jgi:hypothetical protein
MPSCRFIERGEDSPCLVVGSGRVATHFLHYFKLKGMPCANWNRKQHSESELRRRLAETSIVLLLIGDSAIEEFRDANLCEFKGPVVHFSGSLNVAGIESFHPLMTFGPVLYSDEFYERIFFAGASEKRFRALFPHLPNPVFELKNENKALYHALCVMSGNFPQILWQACLSAFNDLQVPNEAVSLYLQRNLENFLTNPAQSLTGPLARKDRGTIERNLNALPENLRPLYQAFVDYYLPSRKGV